MSYGSQSEFGALKRVLLHRPGEEVALVTPGTVDEHHYQRPVSPPKMAEALDAYAGLLRDQGAEVLLLTEVLAGDAEALARVRRRPNMVYLRDTAAVFREGAVIMRMGLASRREDPWIVERALRRIGVPILGALGGEAMLEGGGVSFLDEATCTMGLCDRANEEAVRQLAALVLGRSVEALVVLPCPPGTVHTDGFFMMVDRDLAVYRPGFFRQGKARVLRKGGAVREAWFEDLLAERGIRLAEVPDAWDVNVVCARPGLAVGMARYPGSRKVLEARGGGFLGFDGDELAAGWGGPHCATLPIFRDA